MKKIFCFLAFYIVFNLNAQSIPIVDQTWYQQMRKKQNDTTYIVNFWATWCIPCVNELPNFSKLQQKYKDQKVSIVLVSLDFAHKIKETLIPFVQKKKITLPIVLLNEKGTAWIDEIDANWSGAIPLTIMWNHTKKEYKILEKEINFDELEKNFLQIQNKKID